MSGSQALMETLIAEGIDTIFGYPGGAIMPVYDALYDYRDRIRHILVRHEQGAVHAAQGYARMKNKPGVVLVTSGPGATNAITGIADAMLDSTPLVVICGQVASTALGTDAFQEIDLLGITSAITKWNYQIRRPEDVSMALAKAMYIARTGRPGPVVLDFTKDAQVGMMDEFNYEKCDFIRSYIPVPETPESVIDEAVAMIDKAERPLVVFGHGIIISEAEKELEAFLDKGGIPAASTLLGLSAIPSDNPHYMGMVGMHGNIAPNVMTNRCDLLIAVGMRFDDRVTGVVSKYAAQAKVMHIDIDFSEIGKIVKTDLGVAGDAKDVLSRITAKMASRSHDEWEAEFGRLYEIENEKVIAPEVHPTEGYINMGEAVDAVARVSGAKAVIVTDVGQNQMVAARYSRYVHSRSLISSGGLGTMGFGLPAAIGAKIAAPERQVCLFVGDGGLQMTIEEFGTIMQEKTGVKIVLMDNTWLGNVRQWQELFFDERYSFTKLVNPDFKAVAASYGIASRTVTRREDLEDGVREMLADDAPFLLVVNVCPEADVMPMIPPGKGVDEIMLNAKEWLKYGE